MSRAYWGPLRQPEDKDKIQELHREWFTAPPAYVACDIETISLKDQTIVGIGFSSLNGHAFYYDIWETELPWHLLWDDYTRVIWHNAPFDLSRDALGKYKVDFDTIEDTVILTRWFPDMPNDLEGASAELSNPNWHSWSMKTVLEQYNVKTTLQLPKEVLALKCLRDVAATAGLWDKLRPHVPDSYYIPMREYLIRLLKQSQRGIRLDQKRVQDIDRELEASLLNYKGMCQSMGFNPLSPREVTIALNDAGIVLPMKWNFKKRMHTPDTSEEAIKEIPHSIAQLTLLTRKYNKLHGTYVHDWVGEERAYTTLTMEAATGRTTSRKKNMQNIPTGYREGDIIPKAGKIRSVFIPDDIGMYISVEQLIEITAQVRPRKQATEYITEQYLNRPKHLDWTWGTKFDLGQIELRVLAWLSGDKALQAVLNDEERDLHNEMMERFNIYSRVQTKNIVFGACVYNGGDEEVAKGANITDLNIVRQARHIWAETFPHAWDFTISQQQLAVETMQVQTGLLNRTLNIDQGRKILTEKHIRNCGANWPIQGTAAEAFMLLMLEIEKVIPIEHWLLPIHDEEWCNGVWQIPKEIEYLLPFWTPIEVSYVTRYG